jgi:hypothetical protein
MNNKKDNDNEERWRLTPKGLAFIAMQQVGLINDMDEPRFEGFWTIFERLMERHGYIHYDEENDDDE